MEEFEWNEYRGKSYSELSRRLNGGLFFGCLGTRFRALKSKLDDPLDVITFVSLIGIVPFAAGFVVAGIAASSAASGDVFHSLQIAFVTIMSTSAFVATVAAIVLISRHHNKLSQQEIDTLKRQFWTEVEEKVAEAAAVATCQEQAAKQNREFVNNFPRSPTLGHELRSVTE